MDKEILTKDRCIGHTTVPLGTLSIIGVGSIPPQWFSIKKVLSCVATYTTKQACCKIDLTACNVLAWIRIAILYKYVEILWCVNYTFVF